MPGSQPPKVSLSTWLSRLESPLDWHCRDSKYWKPIFQRVAREVLPEYTSFIRYVPGDYPWTDGRHERVGVSTTAGKLLVRRRALERVLRPKT